MCSTDIIRYILSVSQSSLNPFSAVENLYNASLYTDRQGFRIEDMYFNGIIRLKAGIELNPTIPGKNGQRKFCEHILEGDKYSIIKQKLTKYKNDHPNL